MVRVRFYLERRKDKQTGAVRVKDVPIVGHAHYNSRIFVFFTGERIDAKFWDKKEQRVKGGVAGRAQINDNLETQAEKIRKSYKEALTSGTLIDNDLFRNCLNEERSILSTKKRGFFELWDEYLATRKNEYSKSFIKKKKQVIIITGSTGVGKSYVASALGHQACINGYKVFYANMTKLIGKLKMAKADGSYVRELLKIERQDILILDDFGLQPLDTQGRACLMEIIEDRHGKSSLIITSQVPVKQWYEIIGEKTIADAILERIVHDTTRIELKGESLRKRKMVEADIDNE